MKRILAMISLMLFMLAMSIGCSKAPEAEVEEEIIPYGEGSFRISSDYVVHDSVSKMFEGSEYVLLGYFTDDDPVAHNMSRDPNDPTKESSYQYIEGLYYRFKVVNTLKGSSLNGEKIDVNIEHGYRSSIRSDKTKLYLSDTWYEPEIEEYTVLFLNKSSDTGNYYASGYPYELASSQKVGWWRSSYSDTMVLTVRSHDPDILEWFDMDGADEIVLSDVTALAE